MRKLAIGLLIFVMVAGCNAMPPTVVVVVTNTPDPHVLQVTVTPSGGETSTSMLPSPTVVQPASEIPTVATTEPPTPAASATPGPTATPNVFPTETRAQLYIGQEDFEHGFMFWSSSIKVIWVLNTSATDPNSGTWQTYPDAFNEGQPEIDPNLTPPSPTLYQPRRGFGKLWRETAGLRDSLGWATTPQVALNTTYVYVPGGTVQDNKWVPGPGTHYVTALSHQTFALTQSATDPNKGTWKREP